MTDHDDRVSRRYRELANEEPPPSLDAAIVAHARRAVLRPRSRWTGPVSIAAVLVLAVGITLRLQHEEPGIETSPPASHVPAPAVPAPAMPAPVEPPPETQAPLPEREAPPPPKRAEESRAKPARVAKEPPAPVLEKRERAQREAQDSEASRAAKNLAAPSGAPASPPVATPPPPAAASTTVTPQSAPAASPFTSQPASPARPMTAPTSAPAPLPLQKRSADVRSNEADAARDAELERIATLREAGRNDEADAALAAFRERYPRFLIPDAMWARVKPR